MSVRAWISATGTHSSALCMVVPARPSSTTGQTSLMKRASDVPPLVEKNGDWPVMLATVSLISWVNLPGAVRNDDAAGRLR